MAWPLDGKIWLVITDGDNINAVAGVAVFDPVANTLQPTWLIPLPKMLSRSIQCPKANCAVQLLDALAD
jgi:hypothetical protein